jgi:glycosyltransferase involved in cell wall biosynthesis
MPENSKFRPNLFPSVTLKISFITSMGAYPWGGSEELWHHAAVSMQRNGISVSAHYPSIRGWHPKMDELVNAGVAVHGYGLKNTRFNGWASALRGRLSTHQIAMPWPTHGSWKNADLVVVSQGGISDGLNWLQTLRAEKIPYAIIVQANAVASWPSDEIATQLRECYESAHKVFFVSDDNLRLFRTQVAYTAQNAEVVWNPLNPSTPKHPLPWPESLNQQLNIAMVGRIEPFAKGQDLALEAFASQPIRNLPIHLSVYGQGPWASTCQLLIDQWHLNNVSMRGHAAPTEIWQNHHALLLPSRHEGTSLAMLEALWLGRPVITSRVAGAISEIIDGENGYFIADSSADSLESTIIKAWESKSMLNQFGTNGAKRIRERIPINPGETLARKILELAS